MIWMLIFQQGVLIMNEKMQNESQPNELKFDGDGELTEIARVMLVPIPAQLFYIVIAT
jgi:hypothetical protein